MSLCGIKKYDKLPSKVGEINVDYARFVLLRGEEEKRRMIKMLDFAIELNKRNKEKLKNGKSKTTD